MENFKSVCFVCREPLSEDHYSLNKNTMLPVCNECRGTTKEKKTEAEYLDDMADGLICGCI